MFYLIGFAAISLFYLRQKSPVAWLVDAGSTDPLIWKRQWEQQIRVANQKRWYPRINRFALMMLVVTTLAFYFGYPVIGNWCFAIACVSYVGVNILLNEFTLGRKKN